MNKFLIPIITSIFILGTLGLTQDAFAAFSPLTSAIANDPDDADAVYSIGDTIIITFPSQVNSTFASGTMTNTEFRLNFTFSASDLDDNDTVSGLWNAGATALTITIDTITGSIPPVIDTETISYDTVNGNIGYNGNSTHFAGAAVTLTGDFGLFVAASVTSGGGSGCDDCEAPTLGVDKRGTQLVSNGFTYNGNSIDVERFFTSYPLVTAKVGKQNVAEFKIYENEGTDNIRHFELAFGLAKGESIGMSKAVINWDKSFDGIETVTLNDPENVLDKIKVTTSEGYCSDEMQTKCLIVKVTHTFRAPLDFDILGTNVWDSKRNAWQNYYNHGIEVVGESLNPAKEYDGINKGHIYHLTETSKTTAVDEFGNSWTLEYGLWNKDIQLHKTPVTLFLNKIIPMDNAFAGSDQFGTMYYLIEISKTTAVDMFGNSWTFDGALWTMDYIYSKIILESTPMGGYTRNDSEFNTYKYEQSLLAENKLNEMCSECSIESFGEIDNIFFYDFPVHMDKLDNLEILSNMAFESERAQTVMANILD